MRAQAQCTIEWPRLHGFQTATRSFFVNWQHTRARVLLAQLLVVQLLQSALAVQEPEACSKPTPDDSKASTPCGTHDLSDWLNEADREIRGYHLLCITSLAPSEKVRVSAMRHGLLAGRTVFELPTSDEQSMRHELEMGLEMTAQSRDASRAPAVAIPRLAQPGGYLRQPWRVFDTGGQRMQLADLGRSLARPSQYSQSHLLLVFEGGVWRWPGVRVGFARRILVPGNEDLRLKPSTVTMLTASLSPLVFIFPRSVAPEITSHVLTSASGQMEPSKVGHGNTGESGDVVDLDVSDTDARSSTQTWLWTGRNPELQSVDSFVSTVTRQPKDHMEDTQVLRYDVGQRCVTVAVTICALCASRQPLISMLGSLYQPSDTFALDLLLHSYNEHHDVRSPPSSCSWR